MEEALKNGRAWGLDEGFMKTAPHSVRASSWCRYSAITLVCTALGNFCALATDTWTGAGPNPIWTSALNWSTGAPPVVGDNVIMLGPGNTNNTANVGGAFPTWTLDILQFANTAPSFTIHIRGKDAADGPGMTITGGVINFSANKQYLEVDPGNSNTPSRAGALDFTQNALVLQVQIDNNGGTAVGGGGPKEGGTTTFSGTSSAGLATVNNYGAAVSPAGSAFATEGQTIFKDNALAGNATINNVGGTLQSTDGGRTRFQDSSDAFNATITNAGATATNASGGTTSFQDTATAGGATILNEGSGATGLDSAGVTEFLGSSTAHNATIVNAAGATDLGETIFGGSATAGNASITNNGGNIFAAVAGETLFAGASSTAGNATINNEGGFASGGLTKFFSGTAGNATINNNAASQSVLIGGLTIFNGGTAGNATINNNGAPVAPGGPGFDPAGTTAFENSSSAGGATINNNGGGPFSGSGGKTRFDATSTAENSTIINNGGAILFGQGGQTTFSASSTAGSSTLIANPGAPAFVGGGRGGIFLPGGDGGSIFFNDNSTGGTARVEVFGNGNVDISGHTSPGVTIGSLEGTGNAFLGANNLTIGSNNLSTTFSGVAQDTGNNGGTGGSLTKIGTGMLTLSGTNSYTGATAVNGGELLVDGSIASSSGVTVNAGATLGGHGNVSSISGAGAISPGDSPGILTGTHVDPSGGTSFVFELTQVGSPTYGNAAASGNDVLRLTDTTPFTMSLTAGNQITVDFSGASLVAGQLYRGGFFTDTATATSVVSDATFLYAGLNGFTVHFDGFVTEPMADFAGGTVVNGTVLQFDISGEGNGGGGSTVPETAPTLALLMLSLSVTFGLRSMLNRHSAVEVIRAN
jgi:autotransporter-associated beta strand protein